MLCKFYNNILKMCVYKKLEHLQFPPWAPQPWAGCTLCWTWECKEEGVGTGLVPILGHHHQLQTLRLCKGAEDQALQRVATEGNSLLGNETYKRSGSSCCAVAEVTERVVAEEKIHQRVHPEPNQKKKNVTSISENVPTPITDWCPVCLISFYAFEVYSSQTM